MTAEMSKTNLLAVLEKIEGTDDTSIMLRNMYATDWIRIQKLYQACKDPMLYELLYAVDSTFPGVFAIAVNDFLRVYCGLSTAVYDGEVGTVHQSLKIFNWLIPIITERLEKFYD